MPRGPLGFPRLTSLGPLVEEDRDPQELLEEIKFRAHSYRFYEPDEFIQLLESGVSKRELRSALKNIESGRFYDMLVEAHNFWWPLDVDEMETFRDRNEDLVRWIEVYARLEDQVPPSETVEI